jgi:hypothetical protein
LQKLAVVNEVDLQAQIPGLPGCVLDIDGSVLGKSITGKDSRIKLVMAEHKKVVSKVSC